jgi:hypothetical protein
MSTNQIESLCSPVRPICVFRTGGHSEPNITRTGGSAMHRRWPGIVWLNGSAGMEQPTPTKKTA